MPFARSNGQRLYYTDTGGDGPAVVFSHGLIMSHAMWRHQILALQDRYRCIAWDERGHGETGDADAEFSFYDSAEDLAGLVGELGIEQAVFVGMSQGGMLTIRLALVRPELVRGLVIMDTRATVDSPEVMAGHEQLVEAWTQAGFQGEIAQAVEMLVIGGEYADIEPWRQHWREIKPDNLRQIFATLRNRDDIAARLPEITSPTLIVHGEQDLAIPLEEAELMAREIPNAELAVIAGAGHAANMTHPNEVNAHLERFLASLDREAVGSGGR